MFARCALVALRSVVGVAIPVVGNPADGMKTPRMDLVWVEFLEKFYGKIQVA